MVLALALQHLGQMELVLQGVMVALVALVRKTLAYPQAFLGVQMQEAQMLELHTQEQA